MRRAVPFGLIAVTMICFVLVNIVAAQIVVRVLYPGSGLQVGAAVLTVIGVLAAASLFQVIRGWRAYLRRPPTGN